MKKQISKLLLLVVILCSAFVDKLSAQTNLALDATASTSFVSSWETLDGLNDGTVPANSADRTGGTYGNWSSPNTIQWVQYEWTKEFKLSSTEVYWFTDNGGILIPTVAYIEYWDGTSWVKAGDIGVEQDKFNILELSDILTNKIRVSMLNPDQSTGICEWRVYGGLNLPSQEWSGGPFSFNGTSQSDTVASGVLSEATDFTVSAWIKPSALTVGSRIFDFGSSTDKYMYLTGKGSDNNLQFAISNTGSTGEQFINTTTAIPVDSWQHVAVVKNGADWILYLNGTEVGRNSAITLSLSDLGGLTSNYVGKSQNSNSFFNGQINEFNVFGIFLNETQISSLIDIESPRAFSPADGWIIVSTSSSKKVEWISGSYFTSTNVYFGNSFIEVNASTTPYVSGLAPGTNSVDIPTDLNEGQIYYWRVEEVNGSETRKGDAWKFKYMGPKVKVVLMGGQSNMAGSTPLSEISDDLKHEYSDAIIWVDGQTTAGLAKKWMSLTSGLGYTESFFGPELSFGPEMANYLPGENIALLKCAWGGTNLFAQWRPPSSGKVTGDLYKLFIKSVHDGLAALPEGLEPEIVGMLWMQGEADAIATQDAADEYEYNLTNIIADIRAEFELPQMPFVIGQIGSAPAWDPFGDIIRKAQLDVSKKVPNTSMVITTDYGLTNDPWHYNGAGEISLGKRFATSLNNILLVKGIKVQYFDTNELLDPKAEKIDSLINYNWGSTFPDASITGDDYAVRWSGFIQPEITGNHTFSVETGNGVRLWVDNVLLVDEWANNTSHTFTGDLLMKAGVCYPIKIEFAKNAVDASIKLEWSAEGLAKSIIPVGAYSQNPLFSLDKTGWEIKSVSSEKNTTSTGGAIGVLDNKYTTYWTTNTSETFPQEIVLDLKDTFIISAVDYFPNQVDGTSGNALGYKIYTSLDASEWGTPADSGMWNDNENQKMARFAAVASRYVKLEVLTSSNTSVSASNINVYGLASGSGIKPEADFSSSIKDECLKTKATVTFTDKSENSPINWEWKFGDGATSDEQNPEHVYTQEGKYTVTLVVFNSMGIDSMTIENLVEVKSCEDNREKTIYSDDFSAEMPDYLTGDLTATIWENAIFNTGTMGDPLNNTVDAGAKIEDGALLLTSSNGAFGAGDDDGLYMYRVIPAGVNFEASFQLVGGDFPTFAAGVSTSYNSAGIVVRDVNHSSQNYIYSLFFEMFNIHTMMKRIEAGGQQELINSMDTYSIAEYSWLKLTKEGELFTLSVSKNGETWEASTVATTVFTALNNVDLEVGLSQCNFYTDAAQENKNPTALLDNYKLVVFDAPTSISEVLSSPLNVYSKRNAVVVNSRSEQVLKSVKLYSIIGSLVYSANDINSNRLQIPVSKSGVYIMAANVGGVSFAQKVIVK